MKKLYLIIPVLMVGISAANAGYNNELLKQEIANGVDITSAKTNADSVPDVADGALGLEVYETKTKSDAHNYGVFTPTSMYLRGGVGTNLNFASSSVEVYGDNVDLSGGFISQVGLGWNLSSYVRTELDFQSSEFEFADMPKANATMHSFGGNLCFDFARRYVRTGDITKRRTVVPFMGLGIATGNYEFQGIDGQSGAFIAPRGVLGMNFMLNDLVGVDLSYQYQMVINDGFGWGVDGGNIKNVSDIIASFRFNF